MIHFRGPTCTISMLREGLSRRDICHKYKHERAFETSWNIFTCVEKGDDFSLNFKAYLNSLEYESQYIYLLSFEYYCKIRHTSIL